MSPKLKLLIPLVVSGLIVTCAFYLKQRFYDPKHRIETAKEEVKQLIAGNEIQDGDIIFQTSLSSQSQAIQLATHSEYSHCGIIFKNGNKYIVFEAVQPVKQTPLDKWVARGKSGHYVIKRLKNASEVLTPSALQRMKEVGSRFNGKNYDIYFGWSDEKIYCSELIWKIYKRATGIEVGQLEKLRDFDLSNEAVQEKMKERYGNNLPMDETVISPASIFNSDLLMTVGSN